MLKCTPHATDLFHGPLGSSIVWTDYEDYTVHPSKDMLMIQ